MTEIEAVNRRFDEAVDKASVLLIGIDRALEYLRVCHLANHAGCMIKVDQAIAELVKAQKAF
jgi:hypothetical protein